MKNFKIINEFYYDTFPDLVLIRDVEDEKTQKKGIDKILWMDSGKKLFIDEKKRRKDYGDILLEEYSNFDKKIPGWIDKPVHTDYIVYFIEPSGKIYLLPFILLKNAWLKNKDQWSTKYERKFAQNRGYRTSNIPIPTNILLSAIKKEMNLILKQKQN